MKLLGDLPIAKTTHGLSDAKTKPLNGETMGGSKLSVPAKDLQFRSAKPDKVPHVVPGSAVDSPAALMPQRAVCHGGEEQLAALCEISVFSQGTHCLSAAPASTLLAHSAVADMSLIKEEEQFEISFSFLNRVSYFHQSLQSPLPLFLSCSFAVGPSVYGMSALK